MNEAVRFARGADGMNSDEVLDRVSMCMNELNAMERVDLRPQMITQLPDWERDLAQQALNESRALRHELEALTDPVSLEDLAGRIQNTQQTIYRTWARRRIANMNSDEKAAMTARVLAKLESEDAG
jgi:predicted  nucleic acid-binding Zn-ribbon protein